MKILYFVVFISLFLNGCASHSTLPKNTPYDKNKSYLLIGLKPNYRIHLLRGNDRGEGEWELPVLDMPIANVFPEDGYIVLELGLNEPSQSYGISMVLPEGIGGPVMLPCKNSKTPTFKLERGKLIYAGDINYDYSGSKISFSTSIDEKKAKAYISLNYPNLLSAFATSTMKIKNVRNGNCSPITITIPVYVGG